MREVQEIVQRLMALSPSTPEGRTSSVAPPPGVTIKYFQQPTLDSSAAHGWSELRQSMRQGRSMDGELGVKQSGALPCTAQSGAGAANRGADHEASHHCEAAQDRDHGSRNTARMPSEQRSRTPSSAGQIGARLADRGAEHEANKRGATEVRAHAEAPVEQFIRSVREERNTNGNMVSIATTDYTSRRSMTRHDV